MLKTSTTRRNHVADDILEKAATLFDQQGYSNTPLQDIADAVGIARPSLYHYFKSKEELLAALVERSTKTREQIAARVRKMAGPASERLSELLREIGRVTGANPADLRLMLNNIAVLPPEVRRRSARSRRMMFELVVELLTQGIDDGEFRPLDERQVAATLIAALTGLQYRQIGGVDMDPDLASDLLQQVLLMGISQPLERKTATLEDAIELLHQDLDLLGRHAARRATPDGVPPSQ